MSMIGGRSSTEAFKGPLVVGRVRAFHRLLVFCSSKRVFLVISSATSHFVMSSMARRVGYVFDSVMEAHRGGMGHPERPSRIRAIHERLQDRGLLERMMVLPSRWATGVRESASPKEECRSACYVVV